MSPSIWLDVHYIMNDFGMLAVLAALLFVAFPKGVSTMRARSPCRPSQRRVF
ncbi:hypothetical protein Pan216_06890 [Planctomycetes bacterium Pan216]|uniref:Uncharacterized protein n=1 Tax=Kolteria novifilia TaxID=2527975 RepID=A0A518AYQ4_9BACT|nr:hypothetical protein Pan216_06890 [Planctomycetes bacterium Pan216]